MGRKRQKPPSEYVELALFTSLKDLSGAFGILFNKLCRGKYFLSAIQVGTLGTLWHMRIWEWPRCFVPLGVQQSYLLFWSFLQALFHYIHHL